MNNDFDEIGGSEKKPRAYTRNKTRRCLLCNKQYEKGLNKSNCFCSIECSKIYKEKHLSEIFKTGVVKYHE